MNRRQRDRLFRAYFKAMRRSLTTRSNARSRELYRVAAWIADHDRPTLFGGIR